jgi:dipeptidyl aminopeptidase/acylaminoacyl peptidase
MPEAAAVQPSLSTFPRWRSRKALKKLLVAVALLYVLGTIAGGIGLGWIAVRPPKRPLTPGDETAANLAARGDSAEIRPVALVTGEGVTLHAWFMRPLEANESNGNVVILLHGVSDNRLGMFGYGRWLVRNHYAVLLPDARAHGRSGGLATFGVLESDDIHQWVSFLESIYHPHCVYGLGESMGAAQLLQALPKEPRFCAVVAESPFATFREVAYARFGRQFHTGPWLGRTLFRPTVEAALLFVRLRYGIDMAKASPAQAVAGSKVPVLLIHGLEDRNIPPFHADEIQRENPSDVVVWKVPGAVHTGARQAAPKEFERRVLGWFAAHPDAP